MFISTLSNIIFWCTRYFGDFVLIFFQKLFKSSNQFSTVKYFFPVVTCSCALATLCWLSSILLMLFWYIKLFDKRIITSPHLIRCQKFLELQPALELMLNMIAENAVNWQPLHLGLHLRATHTTLLIALLTHQMRWHW